MKKFAILLSAAFVMTLILDSCSVQKRYHRKGFTVNWNNTSVKMKKNRQVIQSENIQEEDIATNVKKQKKLAKTYNEPVSNDVASTKDIVSAPAITKQVERTFDNASARTISTEAVAPVKTITKESLKSTKKAAKKLIKSIKKNQQRDSKTDTIIYLALILLVPFGTTIAMYLYEGSWTGRVTTNLILTLLCGLPGFIHSLIIIFGNK